MLPPRRTPRATAVRLVLLMEALVSPACYLLDPGQGSISTGQVSGSGDPGGSGAGGDAGASPHAGTGGGGAAGGAEGGSVPPECVSPMECEGLTNECTERTCTGGACGQKTLKPAGTPSAHQTAGDCKVAVCSEDGAIQKIPDETDVPDDGDACTIDSCFGETPSFEDAPAGTPCGASGQLVCDGAGVCHGCNSASDCEPSGACFTFACENAVCVKHLQPDGMDCGECLSCNAGACGDAPQGAPDADCPNNGVCSGQGACQCTDGVQDGDETGVDCGGSCAPCPLTWHCPDACAPPACCSACCLGGLCACLDETALCLGLQGTACSSAGATMSFSTPTPGNDPSCVAPGNPDGLGCATAVCTCQ